MAVSVMFRIAAVAAVFLACAAIVAVARAEVPDAAQVEFARGVEAAAAGDYAGAAASFAEAERIAPESSTIHFNLGLAQAQISGRELSAICWLGAFLAREPYSPLRPSIEMTIDALDAQHRQNVASLVELYVDAAAERPKDTGGTMDWAHAHAAQFWLRLGEVERAKAATARITSSPDRVQKIEEYIKEGRVPGGYGHSGRSLFETPYESDSAFDTFMRWLWQGSESASERDGERARSWASACTGPTLSQPLFFDAMSHLREIGRRGAASEVSASYDAVNTLDNVIDELITVHHSEMFQVRRLLALTAVPWTSITATGAVLAIFAAALLFIVFDVVFRGARATAMPVSASAFFYALALTPAALAACLYIAVSFRLDQKTPEALADWIGLLIGSAFALCMFVGLLIGAIVGMTMILLKLAGRALPAAKGR